MRWIYAARLRMRSLLRGAQVEAELDEELRDHIERQTEAFVGKGMPPDEARAAALRAIGESISRRRRAATRERCARLKISPGISGMRRVS